MSLELYEKNGWLQKQPTSRDEIRNLLSLVERGIADSKVEAISDDLRVIAAFGAALAAASVALRASGYRVRSRDSHLRTVECLEFTIGASDNLIRRMKALSQKRNATNYDAAGNVSAQELQLAVRTADELQGLVVSWLKERHPELL